MIPIHRQDLRILRLPIILRLTRRLPPLLHHLLPEVAAVEAPEVAVEAAEGSDRKYGAL